MFCFFRKSECVWVVGGFSRIYQKKEKKRQPFKDAPVGFPKKIFYFQCRSSTLRATGTMVKYVNSPWVVIAIENGGSSKGRASSGATQRPAEWRPF